MAKFKAGDKVRHNGKVSGSYMYNPAAYANYEVIDCQNNILILDYPEVGHLSWYASDFELISESTRDFKIERPQIALTELAKAAAAYSAKTSIDLDFEDYECWQADWLKEG